MVFGSIGAVVVVALIAGAFAATDDHPGRPRAATSNGPTSTSRPTTTSAATTTTTAAASTTTGSVPTGTATVEGSVPDTTTGPPTGTGPPPPTTTVPSPLPPGTLLGWSHLTQHIEFPDAPVPLGEPIAYNASITNPNDQWVFETECGPFSVNLYIDARKDESLTPTVWEAKPDTSPEFHHATPSGDLQGLLLAPHSSYAFSGTIPPGVESQGVTDNTIEVTIVPSICGNVWGVKWWPGPTGVVTIIPAQSSTTTTAG